MNGKIRWLLAAVATALVLCPAACGVAQQMPVPLFAFCGMEEWAEEAARQPPARLCIQINECEYAHEPVWVEDRETIEAVLLALNEIRVTSVLPDYGVATGTDTYYIFAMSNGNGAEIAFQNGMLYMDPYGREGRLYSVSGMETLDALTKRLELESANAAALTGE